MRYLRQNQAFLVPHLPKQYNSAVFQNVSTKPQAMALYICTRKVLVHRFKSKEITMKQLIAIVAAVAALSAFAAEPAKTAPAPVATASTPAAKGEAKKAETKSVPAKDTKAEATKK